MKVPGMSARLEKEVNNLLPSTVKVKISQPDDMTYSVFAGGSILASLSTFPETLISQDEYEEVGPAVVHRVCF